ncbi:MAG: selenocysteine-specific translation elongation factor [Thermodesulfobacteriota bacterium]
MIYFTVGTAGHIDHGKTALVRALTGMDTDRLAEEKARGLSIELGFAHFDLPGVEGTDVPLHISIVDVPGHERFIRTMLAGTTGIACVLFVVAADDGVMPQTREHLDIVRLLGVESAVMVISKTDRVAPERVEEVTKDLRALLKGTPLEGSPFIAVSSKTGEGIEEVKRSLAMVLSNVSIEERGPFFRLPIDRSFIVKGFGTVVTGTVASGSVSVGDTVSTYSSSKESLSVRVRGIQNTLMDVAKACVGTRAALNLSSTAKGALTRGSLLAKSSMVEFVNSNLKSASKRPLPLRMDCSFDLLPAFPSFKSAGSLKRAGNIKLFHLTGDSLATIRFSRDSAAGDSRVCGRVTLASPLLCLRGDRFILRDTATNVTVGGGRVLLPYYTPKISGKIDSVDFHALEGTGIKGVLNALLPDTETGFPLDCLEYMLNLPSADIIKGGEGGEGGGFFKAGNLLINIERFDALKKKLIVVLTEFHSDNPSEAGLQEAKIPALLEQAERFTGPAIFKVLLDDMIASGLIEREASSIRLFGHSLSLAKVDLRIEKAILELFGSGFTAVKLDELRALSFSAGEIDRVLAYLLKKGRLVKLKQGKFLSASQVELARESLIGALKDGAEGTQRITVSSFRDLLGTGRKIAMEILEYFDYERLTVRHGDYRVLRESKLKRGNKVG